MLDVTIYELFCFRTESTSSDENNLASFNVLEEHLE